MNLPYSEDIKIVTIDMWKQYKVAVQEALPNAVIVVDRFHVIKAIQKILDDQRVALVRPMKKSEKAKINKCKYLLLSNFDNLSNEDILDLTALFDKYPIFRKYHAVKEEFRAIYDCQTRREAQGVYNKWMQNVLNDSDLKPFETMINTVDEWHDEIFNYFDHKYTNGVTESVNNDIKSMQKQGHGYTFNILRARVLYSTSATKQGYKLKTKKKPLYISRDFGAKDFMIGYNFSSAFEEMEFLEKYKYVKDIEETEEIKFSYVDVFELQEYLL